MKSTDLRATDLEVFAAKADRGGAEDHILWSIGLAPEEEPELRARVMFGTLHVFAEGGGGEVSVACLLFYPPGIPSSTEDIRDALVDSQAVENIYDCARAALRTVCALADVNIEIPRKAPSHEFGLLKKAEDLDPGEQVETP